MKQAKRMKKVILILVLSSVFIYGYSQESSLYQNGLTAEQNLIAIGKLAPYSAGAVGYDTRYEGVKGSPALFEKFLPSDFIVSGQKNYLRGDINLELQANYLLIKNPSTGKTMAIPSKMISEVKVKASDSLLVFRVSKINEFEREIKDGRFYQLIRDGRFTFIKLPFKKMIEADYKAAYSADRRYDEYVTYYKYYVRGTDSIFHQVQLSKRSLAKLFPDRKDDINLTAESFTGSNDEELVKAILAKLESKYTP